MTTNYYAYVTRGLSQAIEASAERWSSIHSSTDSGSCASGHQVTDDCLHTVSISSFPSSNRARGPAAAGGDSAVVMIVCLLLIGDASVASSPVLVVALGTPLLVCRRDAASAPTPPFSRLRTIRLRCIEYEDTSHPVPYLLWYLAAAPLARPNPSPESPLMIWPILK